MNQLHVVIGAGPVGWAVSEQLASEGHSVRLLTRSGSGPAHPSIERRRVDIRSGKLAPELADAAAIYNCTHVAYNDKAWRAELPAMERCVLDEAAGAVVVFPESLYSYGDVDGAIHEDSPRAASHRKLGVRTALLAARDAHANPTVSVAASDFYGPRVRASHMGDRVVPAILNGKPIRVISNASVPHSFTYVPDLAAAMITAAATPSLRNTLLHAPTAPAASQREMIELFARAAKMPTPKVGTIPSWLVRLLGTVPGQLRELGDTLYQFEKPFVLDSSRSEEILGLKPTSLTDGTAATVAWWKKLPLSESVLTARS